MSSLLTWNIGALFGTRDVFTDCEIISSLGAVPDGAGHLIK